MNIFFLRGFNNYFNRTIKKYSTLQDYKDRSQGYLDLENINFNPNDGVVTELIIGNPNQLEDKKPLAWDILGTPDYAICYELEGNPTVPVIKFRWFVLESERTRNGQYRIALKRDLIADHYDNIMNAPCFVEKGYVNDFTNPLLYNNENMTYNQIKQSETPLKDSTESGWIIGYVAKNFGNTSGLTPATISADDADPINYIDEADLPFIVNTGAATTVIDADATKTNLNIMTAVAWCDARYGGWGTSYHRRRQSMVLYGPGNNISNYLPYDISDGYLPTSYLESNNVSASTFLGGGTYGNTVFPAMNASFAIDKVNSGTYSETITPINSNLTISTSIDEEYASPINLVAKKYGALPTEISNGTYGNVPTNLYVDYSKIISNSAYNQMLSYYSTNYNWNTLTTYFNGRLATNLSSYNANIKTSNNNSLSYYNGKIIKKDNKYYKLFISPTNTYHIIIHSVPGALQPTYTVNGANTIQIDNNSDYGSYLTNIINSFANGVMDDQNEKLFTGQSFIKSSTSVIEILPKYAVTLEEISTELVMLGGTSETFSATEYTQGVTYDAAYNIFAIPYGRIEFKAANSSTNTYYTSKSEGLGISRWLANKLGSSNLYDLQILPYCPNSNIREYMSENSVLDLSIISGHYQIVFRAPNGTNTSDTSSWSPCSFIFTALSCQGEFNIDQIINISSTGYSSVLDHKISNETELVRLCSPNWGSMFEFSLAKNNGVSKFNVDYTYKPYQPYIHINPDFKGLYAPSWNESGDWNDSRGLILGGDFSIQSSESAWVEYLNNNKNYQSIFNRQIENMDINNQIAKEQLEWQTIAGYFGGGISGGVGGALAGAKVGGPYGAIAGAIGGAYMGTVGAVIGGEMDKDWLQRQQTEAKSYAQDMYGYQLGNIKARPNSLARTEALNNNNKIWPVIEIYNCTDTEKENLINKLRYNSMTIMATGLLKDYSVSDDFNLLYVKGQLIRLDSINDDFHIADAIYQEVSKGFYIPQGGN